MKAGVSIGPWTVWMTPARALPSRASISNLRRCGSSRTPAAYLPASSGRLLRWRRALDPGRLALRRLRHPHLEHALVEAGADAFGLDALRQLQRAAETSVGALNAVEALALLLVLGLALTGHRKHAVLDLDLDVVALHAGQVRPQNEVVLGLDQVHRRNPPPGGSIGCAATLTTPEEGVEEPVHIALESVELPARIPSHK